MLNVHDCRLPAPVPRLHPAGRVLVLFCLAVTCSLLAPRLQAQSAVTNSMLEDEVTVTATGREASAVELPISVSVVTRAQIEASQEESVADLLRRLPGLTLLRSGDEGGATSLFVRGTESDHTLALFDGVRLNSPYFGGYDWSLQTTVGVERIEVARGPFSALWGADALGGVVNVVPQRARAGTKLRLFGEAGEGDWQRLEAAVATGSERFDVLASALDVEGRGQLDNSDFDTRQGLFNGGISWGNGNRAALLVQDLDSGLGIPFSSPGSLTPNRRQQADQLLAALPVRWAFHANWNAEFVLSRVERDLLFRDPDDAFGFISSDTYADTDEVRVASHHTLGRDGRLEASWGAEWRRDEVTAGSNFGIDLQGQKSTTHSLFFQDVVRVTERLTLIAGARWDDAEEWGSELSPRLSVGFDVTPRVAVHGSYGEAFRQPSVGELYFPFSGNLELLPERSRSAELGLTARTGGGRSRLQLAAFSTDTDQLIDFDFASFSFANIERATLRGVEAGWHLALGRSLTSALQVTWLDAEDQDGLALLRRPEWGGSWSLAGSLARRWTGDLTLLFVGERSDVDASTFATTAMPSHLTANLSMAYRIFGELELTARIQNAADRQFSEINGFPAPGRRVLLGARWSP